MSASLSTLATQSAPPALSAPSTPAGIPIATDNNRAFFPVPSLSLSHGTYSNALSNFDTDFGTSDWGSSRPQSPGYDDMSWGHRSFMQDPNYDSIGSGANDAFGNSTMTFTDMLNSPIISYGPPLHSILSGTSLTPYQPIPYQPPTFDFSDLLECQLQDNAQLSTAASATHAHALNTAPLPPLQGGTCWAAPSHAPTTALPVHSDHQQAWVVQVPLAGTVPPPQKTAGQLVQVIPTIINETAQSYMLIATQPIHSDHHHTCLTSPQNLVAPSTENHSQATPLAMNKHGFQPVVQPSPAFPPVDLSLPPNPHMTEESPSQPLDQTLHTSCYTWPRRGRV